MTALATTVTELVDKVNENPDGIADMEVIYQIDVTNGPFQLRFHEGRVETAEGTPWKAACTLEMSDEDCEKLLTGKLNPTIAFMSGKITVKGDLSKALKLQAVIKKYTAS